jgi:hypothetical protein
MSAFQMQQWLEIAWLRTATKGLAAPAKERIRLEIEAHYAEALAAHLAKGLSEPNARMAALADLGDAEKAAKRFRKHHLTERDVEQVHEMLKRAGCLRQLGIRYIIFLGVSWFFLLSRHGEQAYPDPIPALVLGFFVVVLIPTIGFFAVKNGRGRLNLNLLPWLISIPTISVFTFFIFFDHCLHRASGKYFWHMIIFWWSCSSLFYYHLTYKLLKVKEVWREMPPQNIASS